GSLTSIRGVVGLNPEWAAKNFEPGVLGMLGFKVENGVAIMLPLKKAPKVSKSSTEHPSAHGDLGLLHRNIRLPPLTEAMMVLLDKVQLSHDAWVEAVKDGARDADLDEMVSKHHKEHSELESLTRDYDELTLLVLQHHMHDIDRRRPKREIDKLVDKSNAT